MDYMLRARAMDRRLISTPDGYPEDMAMVTMPRHSQAVKKVRCHSSRPAWRLALLPCAVAGEAWPSRDDERFIPNKVIQRLMMWRRMWQ
jgi:hypothetical protein